jgi:hypothetical protein
VSSQAPAAQRMRSLARGLQGQPQPALSSLHGSAKSALGDICPWPYRPLAISALGLLHGTSAYQLHVTALEPEGAEKGPTMTELMQSASEFLQTPLTV